MKKVLLMYKGRLTDRDFNTTYRPILKQYFNEIDIELMPVHHPSGMKKVPRAVQKEWLQEVAPVFRVRY